MDRFASPLERADLLAAMRAYLADKTKAIRLEKMAGRALGIAFRELSASDRKVFAGVVSRCGWARWDGDAGKWTPVSPLLIGDTA
jgi:hypothetical protein